MHVKEPLKIGRGMTDLTHLDGHLDFYSFYSVARHRDLCIVDLFFAIIQAGVCYFPSSVSIHSLIHSEFGMACSSPRRT